MIFIIYCTCTRAAPDTSGLYTKSVVPILLPVPRSEAFALPGIVERATCRGPRAYVSPNRTQAPRRANEQSDMWYISMNIYCCFILTIPKSCEVSERQNQALVTLFYVLLKISLMTFSPRTAKIGLIFWLTKYWFKLFSHFCWRTGNAFMLLRN